MPSSPDLHQDPIKPAADSCARSNLTMIETRELSKSFGSVTAVSNVSLTVEPGEVLGFLGPNGAGKSTTMKMITGFLTPTSGTALVCGHDVQTDALAAKRQVGYLPEGAPLYPDMTPAGLLSFVADMRGVPDKQRRIDEVVERVHIGSVLHQSIDTLSKGYKRRVGLAQAILHDPPVLILDEPTDGLDPNQKHEVRTLIQEMAPDKVIVLSTHILEEVEAVCTRATIIARGELVVDCTPLELMARSRYHNAVSISLSANSAERANSVLESLTSVASVERSQPAQAGADLGASGNGHVAYLVIPRDGCSIVTEISERARVDAWEVSEMSVQRGRLDEVFRDLTNPLQEAQS